MFFIFHIIFLLFPITFFIFHTIFLMKLVLNRMSKKLKSVTKKLFRGKSMAGMMGIVFQGCSTTTSRRAEIMKHIDPFLVGRMVFFQRDMVILLFSYYFAI
jgi:hypothetical protein